MLTDALPRQPSGTQGRSSRDSKETENRGENTNQRSAGVCIIVWGPLCRRKKRRIVDSDRQVHTVQFKDAEEHAMCQRSGWQTRQLKSEREVGENTVQYSGGEDLRIVTRNQRTCAKARKEAYSAAMERREKQVRGALVWSAFICQCITAFICAESWVDSLSSLLLTREKSV